METNTKRANNFAHAVIQNVIQFALHFWAIMQDIVQLKCKTYQC